MTKKQAINLIRYRIDTATEIAGKGADGKAFEDLEIAIKALEELNLYEENGLCLIPSNVYKKQCEELDKLKAKATPLKPLYGNYDDNGFDEIIPYKAVCPNCGHEFEFGYWNDEDNHHCVCGQAIDWFDCRELVKPIELDDEEFGKIDCTIFTVEPHQISPRNMEVYEKYNESVMKLVEEYLKEE